MTGPNAETDTSSTDAPRLSRSRDVIASYPEYADAQRAVDSLSDRSFPVQHLSIVGEELRTVERVTGRLTTGKAALAGAGSGAAFGALLGFLLGLFTVAPFVTGLALALYGLLLGAVLGAAFGAIGHAALGGRRDFSSVRGLAAGRYDVVCDTEYAARATELLADLR